jgi:hypothetical protein
MWLVRIGHGHRAGPGRVGKEVEVQRNDINNCKMSRLNYGNYTNYGNKLNKRH